MDRTTLGRAVKPLERDKLLTIEARRRRAAAQAQADRRRRDAPQGRRGEVARGAEGVRAGVRRCRVRRDADGAAPCGVRDRSGRSARALALLAGGSCIVFGLLSSSRLLCASLSYAADLLHFAPCVAFVFAVRRRALRGFGRIGRHEPEPRGLRFRSAGAACPSSLLPPCASASATRATTTVAARRQPPLPAPRRRPTLIRVSRLRSSSISSPCRRSPRASTICARIVAMRSARRFMNASPPGP